MRSRHPAFSCALLRTTALAGIAAALNPAAPARAQSITATGDVVAGTTLPNPLPNPWTADELKVGNSGTGTLAITNGGQVFSTGSWLGFTGTGTVTVDGANSSWTDSGVLSIGFMTPGKGTLIISNNGSVHIAGGVAVAAMGTAQGTINIGAAQGQTAVAPGILDTPKVAFGQGTGLLNFNHTDTSGRYSFAPAISGAGTVTANAGYTVLTGDSSGFTGTASVKGGTLEVDGTLGGASYTTSTGAATTIGAAGQIIVTGAFTQSANATLNVAIGANNPAITAASAAAAGALNITGYAGGAPGATFTVIHTTAGITGDFTGVTIGQNPSTSVDYLTVSALKQGNDYIVTPALTWFNDNSDAQHMGSGTFTLAGASSSFTLGVPLTPQAGNADWDGDSLTKAGPGTLILTAANSYTGATSITGGTLALSGGGAIAHSSGVSVTGGAVFDIGAATSGARIASLSGAGNVTLGGRTLTLSDAGGAFSGGIGGTGGLVLAGGSQILAGANSYTGGTTVDAGTLQAGIAGAFVNNTAYAVNGGTLDLNGFGLTMSSLSGTGGTITSTAVATLTVSQSADTRYAGGIGGGVGLTKTGAGTLTLTGASSYAGDSHADGGTLAITDGGSVSDMTGYIGTQSGLAGTATVDGAGSQWTHSAALYVGYRGFGALNVTGGAMVGSQDTEIGSIAGATGAVRVDGASIWTNSGTVGGAGAGTLILSNGGRVDAVSVTLARDTGSHGTIAIGGPDGANATAAGTLNATVVAFGAGTGMLSFNHTATAAAPYVFSAALSNNSAGDAELWNQAGYTVLSADSSGFTGITSVAGGTLAVDGKLGGEIQVGGPGTLTGSGSVGAVEVALGGTLAGASGSTLTMGALVLHSDAVVSVALGAASAAAPFHVTGDLTLDGALNVTARPGFGDGLYRLIDYDGTLIDNGLDIGTKPAGWAMTVQTSTAQQVNLLVAASGGGTPADDGSGEDGGTAPPSQPVQPTGIFNFWNGPAGGSGAWSKADANWTDRNDLLTGVYDPAALLIFTGTGGTVAADGALAVDRGLQFAADGYSVTGGALVLGADRVLVRVGDGTAEGARFTATIASPLTGAGGIDKDDLGTLVLTGANDYAGGTTISNGTLAGSAGSFGTGAILDNAALVIDQGDDAAFANALSGTGQFIKRGAGRLDMTGTVSFSGATRVEAGTLAVNGSLAGSAVTVAEGGRIGGNGTIGGLAVQAGGAVAPGNAIGTLHVAGDVAFASGSTYQIEVDATGAADRIAATGKAALAGNVQALAGAGTYAPATTYTILSADSGVTGTFTDVTSNLAFLTPTLIYGANAVTLTMTRNDTSFASIGGTRNQRAAGGGVDTLGAGNAIWDAAVQLDAPAARTAFDRLSGEIHASAKTALVEDSRLIRDAALDRMRSGGEGGTVWGRGLGSWGHSTGDGNAAKVNRSTGGMLLGVDGVLPGGVRLGVMTGWSRTSLSGIRGSGTSNNAHLGAYAGGQWGALALRTGAAVSWNDITTNRSASFTGFTDTPKGDYAARTAQAFGELGYTLHVRTATIEPFANIAHVRLHTDGFTETGGAAALTVAASTTDATFATAGLHGAASFDLAGLRATARATLGWRHAFGKVVPVGTMAFAGGDGFTTAGVPIAKNAAVTEAGLDFAVARNATLGLSYSGQTGSRLSDQSGRVTFGLRF